MSDIDPLRNLAQALTNDPGQPVTMTKGVVTNVSIGGQPPTCEIQLSGDTTTTIQGVRFIDSYSPAIGDVVQVIKQGPMLLILGQIAGGADHVANGWRTPVLLSGWAEFSFDPPMYRLILDNGSKKVQLRGRVDASGTPSYLWTMPAEMRPVFNLAPVLLPRDPNGAVAAQLNVLGGTDGRLQVVQTAVGVGSVGTTTSSTAPGSGQPVGAFGVDQAGVPTTNVVYNPPGGNIQTDHRHAMPHSHNVNSHSHNVTVNAPGFPTFISLNGIEYFI